MTAKQIKNQVTPKTFSDKQITVGNTYLFFLSNAEEIITMVRGYYKMTISARMIAHKIQEYYEELLVEYSNSISPPFNAFLGQGFYSVDFLEIVLFVLKYI